MPSVVLFNPEIPQNTGNIMRLCANTATPLHLIRPMGFELDSTKLKRAGMDYREYATVVVHDSFDQYLVAESPGRLYAFTRNGDQSLADLAYGAGDAFLFGPESVGLPDELVDRPEVTSSVRIPMTPHTRSLNLANSVAIAVYEAARQAGYPFAN